MRDVQPARRTRGSWPAQHVLQTCSSRPRSRTGGPTPTRPARCGWQFIESDASIHNQCAGSRLQKSRFRSHAATPWTLQQLMTTRLLSRRRWACCATTRTRLSRCTATRVRAPLHDQGCLQAELRRFGLALDYHTWLLRARTAETAHGSGRSATVPRAPTQSLDVANAITVLAFKNGDTSMAHGGALMRPSLRILTAWQSRLWWRQTGHATAPRHRCRQTSSCCLTPPLVRICTRSATVAHKHSEIGADQRRALGLHRQRPPHRITRSSPGCRPAAAAVVFQRRALCARSRPTWSPARARGAGAAGAGAGRARRPDSVARLFGRCVASWPKHLHDRRQACAATRWWPCAARSAFAPWRSSAVGQPSSRDFSSLSGACAVAVSKLTALQRRSR